MSRIELLFSGLCSEPFDPKPLNNSLYTLVSLFVQEIGSDFNGLSVVWNDLVHPFHVSQTTILHPEAEDFWVFIGMDRP